MTLRMRNKGFGNHGFTLLELLLSLAITAVITVIIFGIFRFTVRAWEKGEQDLAPQQRLRSVLHLMHNQMASATPSAQFLKSERAISFSGDSQSMALVSKVALDYRHGGGTVFCLYTVESGETGVSLYATEKSMPVESLEEAAATNAGDRLALLSGMHAIDIAYLYQRSPRGDHNWLPQWESTGVDRLPWAVRLQVVDKPGADPVVLVVSLRSREQG
jgi:prepilin-type N-terminal cleavage/methylation domain-containing protein